MSAFAFFVGLHQPSDARHFERACISINRLRGRRSPLAGDIEVIIDSGAFTEINLYGGYRHGVEEYAADLYRLHTQGIARIAAAVAQDYMCERFMLAKTGLTVADHQRLTVERYDALLAELERLFGGACPFRVMPVLQGYTPADYVRHVRMYGARLTPGMWVGVGSVCKRNGTPQDVAHILAAIKQERPDLALHGFGLKLTALLDPTVRRLLATADSMAWSFSARKQGRSANDWREAHAFCEAVRAAARQPAQAWQASFDFGAAA